LVLRRRAGLAPEHAVEEIIIGLGKITVIIARGPECVIEYVRIGIGPEHRPVPRHEGRAQAEAPGPAWGERSRVRAEIGTLLCCLRCNTRDTVTTLAALRLRIGVEPMHSALALVRRRLLG
jgi:hypothetical protein